MHFETNTITAILLIIIIIKWIIFHICTQARYECAREMRMGREKKCETKINQLLWRRIFPWHWITLRSSIFHKHTRGICVEEFSLIIMECFLLHDITYFTFFFMSFVREMEMKNFCGRNGACFSSKAHSTTIK